jgi:hypothetical protein
LTAAGAITKGPSDPTNGCPKATSVDNLLPTVTNGFQKHVTIATSGFHNLILTDQRLSSYFDQRELSLKTSADCDLTTDFSQGFHESEKKILDLKTISGSMSSTA